MKLNFKLLLAMVIITSFKGTETKGCKKIKYLNVCKLHVLGNEIVDGNLTVNGTLTVSGENITSNSSSSSSSSSFTAYGSFYSNANLTAPSAITLTPGINFPAGAFTPFNNGTGTGVTVANAGTYLVWFSLLANNDVTEWQLNTSAGLVAGSNVDNGTDNTFANGFPVMIPQEQHRMVLRLFY